MTNTEESNTKIEESIKEIELLNDQIKESLNKIALLNNEIASIEKQQIDNLLKEEKQISKIWILISVNLITMLALTARLFYINFIVVIQFIYI